MNSITRLSSLKCPIIRVREEQSPLRIGAIAAACFCLSAFERASILAPPNTGGWAEGRAKAYGITVDELPSFYAKRTLMNETVLPEDIANACYAFVCGLLNKSTGNVLNVDGGVAAAFVR